MVSVQGRTRDGEDGPEFRKKGNEMGQTSVGRRLTSVYVGCRTNFASSDCGALGELGPEETGALRLLQSPDI